MFSAPNEPFYMTYVYEEEAEEAAAFHAHEMAAEQAWLRHAERFDPEAQADLELHDALFQDGYR